MIEEPKKMLIIDCRSYGAAFANRAKGGGVECPGELAQIRGPVPYSDGLRVSFICIVVGQGNSTRGPE